MQLCPVGMGISGRGRRLIGTYLPRRLHAGPVRYEWAPAGRPFPEGGTMTVQRAGLLGHCAAARNKAGAPPRESQGLCQQHATDTVQLRKPAADGSAAHSSHCRSPLQKSSSRGLHCSSRTDRVGRLGVPNLILALPCRTPRCRWPAAVPLSSNGGRGDGRAYMQNFWRLRAEHSEERDGIP